MARTVTTNAAKGRQAKIDSKSGESNQTTNPATSRSGRGLTKRPARAYRLRHSARSLATVALMVGALVGLTTFMVNRVALGSPQAQTSIILDERQVRWPFYGAVYTQAEAVIAAHATFEASRANTSDPSLAKSISLEPSTDQSIVIVTATAATDAAALQLADAAATELVEYSRSERLATEAAVVNRLSDEVEALIEEQAVAKMLFETADNEADQIVAEKDLEHAADRLNLKRTALQVATETMDNSGPVFITTGQTKLKGQVTQSLLASVSAGAGSMVLVLLAFSLLASSPDDE